MNTDKLLKQLNDKKKIINNKYGMWMKKIDEYRKEIENASIKYAKNSSEFIEKKIKLYNDKINELQKYANNWKDEQLKSVQSWLNEQISNVNKQIESQTKQIADTINAFK